jgi:hypothetical protein
MTIGKLQDKLKALVDTMMPVANLTTSAGNEATRKWPLLCGFGDSALPSLRAALQGSATSGPQRTASTWGTTPANKNK